MRMEQRWLSSSETDEDSGNLTRVSKEPLVGIGPKNRPVLDLLVLGRDATSSSPLPTSMRPERRHPLPGRGRSAGEVLSFLRKCPRVSGDAFERDPVALLLERLDGPAGDALGVAAVVVVGPELLVVVWRAST